MAESSSTVGESVPETTLQRSIMESTGTFSLETNYQKVKSMGVGEFVSSRLFRVGGRDWEIRLYPTGITGYSAGYASAYLRCASRGKNTSAKFTLTLLEKEGQAAVASDELDVVFDLENPAPDNPPSWGFQSFVEKSKLKSLLRRDDGSFTIRCVLTVRKESPPMELPGHLQRMLQDGQDADVTFMVGDGEFRAHSSLLAARSPEFCEKFFGPTTAEKGMPPAVKVVVDGVEPTIFKMLLHYLYTDLLPPCPQDEGGYRVAELQHLMVAACSYKVDRLRLMCEEQLCAKINMDTIKTMYALANKHNCNELKDACLAFMASSTDVLGAILETVGIKEVFMTNCRPLPLDEGASRTKGSSNQEDEVGPS